MAISWSNWVGSGFGRARVGVEVSWSGLTWTARVYLTLGASSSWNQVTLNRSGAWSGSSTVTHHDPSGSAVKLIYTGTGSASAGQSLTFGVAMSGVWSGNNPSHSLTVTAPVNPPAAPTGVTVSRTSDTSQKVDWSASSTTAAPIVSQRVLRREYGKTEFVSVAAISNGTVRTFTDNTTASDRDYEYAVEVKNSAGSATSAWVRIQTTPVAPVSVSAVKSGADIVVTIVPGTSIECAHVVEHSADGGSSWVALGTIAAGQTTYTHSSPSNATTHTYRVRAVTPTNGLVSAWRQSNTVVLVAPPNAPTNLSPNGVFWPSDEDVFGDWTYNPVDTTRMTWCEFRYRLVGESSWADGGEWPPDYRRLFDAGEFESGQSIEWQVRTWGQHPDPSPWSDTAVIHFSTRPTATINEPSSDIYAASLTTEWTFFSAAGATQAAYRAQLLQGATVVETVSGTGTASSATFAHRLEDGETYTVTVELQDSSGLWGYGDSVTFDVVYLPPAAVSLDLTFDEDTGRVYISATPSDPVEDVTDTIDRIDIQRRIDGGEWVTVLTGLAPDAFTFDAFAHTRGVSEYRAVSWSPIDAASNGPAATITVMSECSYLNWGPGRGEVARLLVGQTFSEKSGYEHALVQFAANTYPTLMAGNARSRVLSVTAATVAGVTSSPLELHAATAAGTTVAWRDATGRRIERGALSGVSDSSSWAPLASVSFDITHIA